MSVVKAEMENELEIIFTRLDTIHKGVSSGELAMSEVHRQLNDVQLRLLWLNVRTPGSLGDAHKRFCIEDVEFDARVMFKNFKGR